MEFPDLVCCHTCGSMLEETMVLAQEALGLYLAMLLENGEELPQPSSLEDIKSEHITSYMVVDVDNYRRKNKAVIKSVSIPEWLADEAEENHLSLSKVLQDGLKEHLGYK